MQIFCLNLKNFILHTVFMTLQILTMRQVTASSDMHSKDLFSNEKMQSIMMR